MGIEELQRYHKDAPFTDPVVRCDSCQALLFHEKLCKDGMCEYCGNTRVRNVRAMSGEDMEKLRASGVDPEWIALFEEKA